jgi:hypothetical protein
VQSVAGHGVHVSGTAVDLKPFGTTWHKLEFVKEADLETS